MASQMDMGNEVTDVDVTETLRDARRSADGLNKKFRPGEETIRGILLFCGVVSIFTTLGIVFVLGEQSLLFFQTEAWVLAKAPEVEEGTEPEAFLVESISAGQTRFTLAFDGQRIPFNTNQFIRIGDETMQITDRDGRLVTVERGVDKTTATEHPEGEGVLGMREIQIRPMNELGGLIDTRLEPRVVLEPGDTVIPFDTEVSDVFEVDDVVYLGAETMRITEVRETEIVVERGFEGTEAIVHGVVGDPLVFDLGLLLAEQFELPNLPPPLIRSEPTTNSFELVEITEEDTVIQLSSEFDFGREFEEGQEIRLEPEVMRVVSVDREADTVTVERGVESRVRNHDTDETIQFPEPVTLGEFVTSTQWQPQVGNFGIWPLLLSTLIISSIALLVSVPLGLGAAIFLSEYAEPRVRSTLKPILEVLAGIPTVVYGFFALTFITPGLQGIFGNQVQFYNMLSAGIVVGVLIVPLISSLSEDALSAVPQALREASYGLGATKLETTIKVVLPAAVSGVLAAIILATSRAVGETMIVAIAAGAGPNFTFNVFEGAETMTGHIARISGGDLSYNSIDYNSIFSIGATLFLLTLSLNLFSGYVRDRLQESY